jgi:hypothetical protein
VEELRVQIREAIDDGTCASLGAFGEKRTAKNFSVDHATPVSRGGSHKLDNLIVCSRSDNLAKGIMTPEELNKLLDAMAHKSPEASSDLDRAPEGRRRRSSAAFRWKKTMRGGPAAVAVHLERASIGLRVARSVRRPCRCGKFPDRGRVSRNLQNKGQ